MRYGLTEVQCAFVDSVTKFLAGSVPPTARRDWLGKVGGQRYRELWSQCAELGWSALFDAEGDESAPDADPPVVDAAVIAEVAGRVLAPTPFLGCSVTMAALYQEREAANTALIQALCAGTTIATLGWEEPGGIWELNDLTTTVRQDGDELIIDGVKVNVPDVAVADVFCVVCRYRERVVVALVLANALGVTVTPKRGLDLLREHGTLQLDRVRVPGSAVLDRASDNAADVTRFALSIQLAESVGALDQLFSLTVEYARSRYAFGRPIGSFQALKHRIADLMLWVEGCKAIVDTAIDAVSVRAANADLCISLAKTYVGERAVRVAQECTQIFGGIGLTWEHDAHLYLRRLTVNRALLGTPEQHRLRVAKLLGVAARVGGDT